MAGTSNAELVAALQALQGVTEALNEMVTAVPATDVAHFGGAARITAVRNKFRGTGAIITAAKDALENQNKNRKDAIDITPITTIYEITPAHIRPDQPDMKTYRLEDFKGDREKCSKDTYICLDWLTRALTIADDKKINHELCKKFLQTHATHDAGRTVRNAINDGKTLTQIVLDLEINYAGLVHPDLAHENCKTMTRKENETMRTFGERIRLMAEMACRDKPEQHRKEQILQLAKDTFMSALRPNIKQELRANLDMRRRAGEPEADYNQIVSEVHTLDESRTAHDKIYRHRKDGNGGIRRVENNYDSDTDDDSSEELGWDHDGNVITMTPSDYEQNIRVLTTKERARFFNKKYDPKKKTYQKYRANEKTPYKQNNPYAGRALMAEQFEEFDEDGEYFTLRYVKAGDPPRIRSADLNVKPNECARCGIAGHRAHGPDANKCPLRMHIMQTEPCRACNKGGHEAKVCPRVANLEKN